MMAPKTTNWRISPCCSWLTPCYRLVCIKGGLTPSLGYWSDSNLSWENRSPRWAERSPWGKMTGNILTTAGTFSFLTFYYTNPIGLILLARDILPTSYNLYATYYFPIGYIPIEPTLAKKCRSCNRLPKQENLIILNQDSWGIAWGVR